jgi:RNAse (barnase) inhibitor barstar
MRKCLLDGSRLADASAVYRALAEAFEFPMSIANSPEQLIAALDEYRGEPIAVVWRRATQSADRLGEQFEIILAALQTAAANGTVSLQLR